MTKGKKFTIISMAALLILCTAIVLLGVALTTSGNTYVNSNIDLVSVASEEDITVPIYSYSFKEYQSQNKTIAMDYVYNQYVSSVSKQTLDETYSEWRFVDENGDTIEIAGYNGTSALYPRFAELPTKMIYNDYNAKKTLQIIANNYGIQNAVSYTWIELTTTPAYGIDYYLTSVSEESLNDTVGTNQWGFYNSSNELMEYSFIGSGGGGKFITFQNEYPTKFIYNYDGVGEVKTEEVSFSKLFSDSTSFIDFKFILQKKNKYLILPQNFFAVKCQGSGDFIKIDSINYLGYNVIDYDIFKAEQAVIGYDNSNSNTMLIINASETNGNSTVFEYLNFNIKDSKYYLDNIDGEFVIFDKNFKTMVLSKNFYGYLEFRPSVIFSLEQNFYNINYKLNGGNYLSIPYPKTVTNWFKHELITPWRQGYSFEGFYDNPEFNGEKITYVGGLVEEENPKILTEDITLYAKWSPSKSEVRYELNGGQCDNIEDYTSYTNGTDMVLPIPEREGYDFEGWYLTPDFENTTEPNKDKPLTQLDSSNYYGDVIHLYAKWKEILYNITYKLNGGNYLSIPYPKTFGIAGAELPVPWRQGYSFAGFYLDENFNTILHNNTIPANFEIAEDVTVYAKWSASKSEVRYELNGGQCDNIEDYTSYTNGTDMVLPIPEREGYDFEGWYLTPDFENTTEPNKDKPLTQLDSSNYYGDVIHLYAKWEIKKFVVTYHFWGVHPAYIKQYEYGEKFNDLSIMAVAVKNGTTLKQYKFLGWSTTAINVDNFFAFDENTKIDEFNKEVITETIDLYAVYYGYSSQTKISISKEVTLYSSNDFTDFTLYNLSTYDYKLVTLADDNDIDSVLNNSSEDNKNVFDKTVDSVKDFFSSSKETVSNWVNDNKAMFWTVIVIIIIIFAVIIVFKCVL